MKNRKVVWILLALALLLMVGVDQYLRHKRAVQDLATCRRQVDRLASAVESHTRRQGRPPQSLDRLVPRTISALPMCPAAGAETYSAGYKTSRRKDGSWLVIVGCAGGFHRRLGSSAVFPARELKLTGLDALPKSKTPLGR